MALKVGLVGYREHFPKLPPSARFRHYAALFPTVELPSTRERIPAPELVARWARQAPPGFTYSFQSPKHLQYRPTSDERRTLRKFLRRHRQLGEHRGGVRFLLPETLDPEAFREWLLLLKELGFPGDYAFDGPPELEALALAAGHAAVRLGEGRFRYLVDPPALPKDLSGYAYFHRLEDALPYSSRPQGGTQ